MIVLFVSTDNIAAKEHTHTLLFYLLHVFIDRTVKVWNLKTGADLLTLDKHFSYVRCVRYSPRNSLIFTASQSHIKVCVL